MDNFCEIEKFEICRSAEQAILILNGTFSYVKGSLHLYAVCDGKRFDTHAWIIPMEQGSHAVKHHLEVEWHLDGIPEHLKLVLQDEEGKQNEVLSCSSRELQEHIVNTSLIYNLQSASLSEDHTGSVIGWAFSARNKEVQYAVVNGEGKQVRTTLRRTLEQRLCARGVVAEEDSLCGFILTFEAETEQSYILQINDGIHTQEIPLAPYLQANTMNAGKVVRLMHMINKRNIDRGMLYLKKNGLVGFVKRLSQGVTEEMDYDAWFKRNRISEEELVQQRAHEFAYAPKISILVPTFNTPSLLLEEMMQSVFAQSYRNWELCIADGSDASSDARRIILDYQKKDDRIKVTLLQENYGISGNTNQALALADGEYTALFDHDDLLEPDALYEIVQSLQETHHDIVYTDEDKLNDRTKRLEDPNFKPDYDEDLILSHNYITHFFVVKTDIIKGVGGFDSAYDGSQDYEVMFKCIEKSDSIHHVAKSLYHWRMHEGSTALDPESKMYCYIAGQKAIQHHLDRIHVKAHVEMQKKPLYGLYHVRYAVPDELISIIIPNKDHADVLKTCVDSLYQVNDYAKIEIVIVENNSTEPQTFAYYEQLQKQHDNLKVVTWKEKEFNYSAINNYGVQFASGSYLLFLNNDTEVMQADALREMLGLCARDNVGAVGAKLLYGDNTIQHAGVIVGFSGYAGHVFNDIPNGKDYGYMTRDVLNGDLSAVTAACMMTKKEVFAAVHGFDEQFKVACNDIDYCLKVREMGKLVAYNAFALWHHYESKSRGYENGFDKTARFDDEVARWQKKWMPVLLAGDPYYNRNFKVEDGPFILP